MNCPNCGTPVNPGSTFCMKCGYRFSIMHNRCAFCGSEIPPGAKFCFQCGSPTVNSNFIQYCKNCGFQLKPCANFCEKCGTPIHSSPTTANSTLNNNYPNNNQPEDILSKAKNKLLINSNSTTKNRKDIRKILMYIAIAGICITCFGFFGKVMESVITKQIQSEIGTAGYFVNANDIWNGISCFVLGDTKGAINALKKYESFVDIFDLGFSGSDATSFISPLISNLRSEIKKEFGASWYFILIVAISTKFFVPGIVLTVVTAISWLLLGGTTEELQSKEFVKLYILCCVWIVILILFMVLGTMSIRSVDYSSITDFL